MAEHKRIFVELLNDENEEAKYAIVWEHGRSHVYCMVRNSNQSPLRFVWEAEKAYRNTQLNDLLFIDTTSEMQLTEM